MPFCTRCGHKANETDAFCANCGASQSQSETARPRPSVDPLAGLSPRTAAILCYIPAVGWIAAIMVLAARRFKDDRTTRFHAFQGLYLFAAWLLVDWVVGPIVHSMPGHFFPVDLILHALILGTSVFMIIKASHSEVYVLPIIGELAQKSLTEQ